MTFQAALLASLLRSLVISNCGLCLAKGLHRQLNTTTSFRLLWILLLVPLLTPSLVTGYCYRDTAMALVHSPVLKESLYTLIVLAQLVPVAVILLQFSPTAEVTRSALAIAQQHRLPWRKRILLWLRSPHQFALAAWCLLFLLSFQEAELASLMQSAGWTEWLFTRHAGGLMMNETLRLVAVPALLQIPIIVPLSFWLSGVRAETGHAATAGELSRFGNVTLSLWLFGGLLLVTVIPVWQLLVSAWQGSGSVLQQPELPREIGDSLLIAVTSGSLAILLGKGLIRCLSSQHILLTIILLMPGCVGGLTLGLAISAILQTELLEFAYDSPIPLIVAEVLYLLPRTLVLLRCHQRALPSSSRFVLHNSIHPQHREWYADMHWRLIGRNWLYVGSLVCFWSYLELMLPSLLVYPGMAPVSLVLYNAMHYGRISALGAKLWVTLIVPCLLLLIVRFMWRIGARWFVAPPKAESR